MWSDTVVEPGGIPDPEAALQGRSAAIDPAQKRSTAVTDTVRWIMEVPSEPNKHGRQTGTKSRSLRDEDLVAGPYGTAVQPGFVLTTRGSPRDITPDEAVKPQSRSFIGGALLANSGILASERT